MGDLDKLIRLESFLRDEPDSRHEVVIADLRNKSDEELREMIRREMETLQELEAHDAEVRGWNEKTRLLPGKEPGDGADDAPV